MEKLVNVVVRDADMGKSGVSKYGPWQAWNVYLLGYEEKFGYFEKDNIVPFVGMEIALLEYAVEQNGDYTNYTIKKLVPAQLTAPGTSPASDTKSVSAKPRVKPTHNPIAKPAISGGLGSAEKSKRVTMCTSYAKDIMVAMLGAGGFRYKDAGFGSIVDAVAKAGLMLAEKIEVGAADKSLKPLTVAEPEPESKVPVTPEEVPEDTGIAFANTTITPATVRLANDALSGVASDQLGLPGMKPGLEDDIPF